MDFFRARETSTKFIILDTQAVEIYDRLHEYDAVKLQDAVGKDHDLFVTSIWPYGHVRVASVDLETGSFVSDLVRCTY